MRPIATTRSSAGMPTGLLAVWWVVFSEIVIFGGLLASYIMHRLAHDSFATQAAHTNTWIGAFNTFVLLTSSLTAVLAHQAAEAGDGKKAARLLLATVGGAVVFVLVKATEWTIEINAGYTITANTFSPDLTSVFGVTAGTSSQRRSIFFLWAKPRTRS